MCILFFAINKHPKYPLIICANRDEFHNRPTKSMHWWPKKNNKSNILAGKDLQAGGTWLGINKHGRFSALTNFRLPDLQDDEKKSRGALVLQALESNNKTLIEALEVTASQYNAFNLVFGSSERLFCFDSTSKKTQILSTGFHSLCNGALDDIWPKMALGQNQLEEAINNSNEDYLNINELFKLMQNKQQAKIESLPKTGVPLNLEQLLSSIFIESLEYGTRTTNIIVQDKVGKITIYDKSYNNLGNCTTEQNFIITTSNLT